MTFNFKLKCVIYLDIYNSFLFLLYIRLMYLRYFLQLPFSFNFNHYLKKLLLLNHFYSNFMSSVILLHIKLLSTQTGTRIANKHLQSVMTKYVDRIRPSCTIFLTNNFHFISFLRLVPVIFYIVYVPIPITQVLSCFLRDYTFVYPILLLSRKMH